jgi:hypothetical protein
VAIVHYSPNVRGTGQEHVWIEIRVGDQTRIIQQVAEPRNERITDPETFDTWVDRMTKNQSNQQAVNAERYAFELSNGTKALDKANALTKLSSTGNYSETNTCAWCRGGARGGRSAGHS